MGVIINIDEALKNRSQYNILREPLNQLIKDRQEAWEKENPIDLLYNRSSMDRFQVSFTSNIGFNKAFVETNDYAVGPIFNTTEGFSATYRTRTFQGSFIITQQVLEDEEFSTAADTAKQFTRRWHGDIVEYAMTAMQGAFGEEVVYGDTVDGKSRIKLTSADTTTGDVHDTTKNPLFTNAHTIVKRDGMTTDDITAAHQSNCFYANIDVTSSSPDRISALADVINQVISTMENYKDDNNKYAGVDGDKTIVACNNPHVKSAINTALSLDMFHQGDSMFPNPAYQRATANYTPYLNDIECTAATYDTNNALSFGFFIVDKAYNAENHGPEFTERIPFTLDVTDTKRPSGIIYDGRQRFDINVASWRGIAYVRIGVPAGATGEWDDPDHFTKITPVATIVKPVQVVGTVTTV